MRPSRRYGGGVNVKVVSNPDVETERPRVTVEDLRRFAEAVRDPDDPAVMACAWRWPDTAADR